MALFECERHKGNAGPAGGCVTCEYLRTAVRLGYAMVVPLAAPGEGRALVRYPRQGVHTSG